MRPEAAGAALVRPPRPARCNEREQEKRRRVPTAKKDTHRPGTAPALGLRAGIDAPSSYRRPTWKWRPYHAIPQLAAKRPTLPRSGPDGTQAPAAMAAPGRNAPAAPRTPGRPMYAGAIC